MIGIIVVVLAGGAALVWKMQAAPTGTPVHLEAANATADPAEPAFTDSVVRSDVAAASGLPTNLKTAPTARSTESKELALKRVPGDTPNLYATIDTSASQNEAPPLCNKDQLRSQLVRANTSAKAKVWNDTVGDGAAVQDTVDGLTPMLLGQDTAVTEFGFDGDHATPYQAILQAGTAVLVDQSAQPRVRCANGNPLGPPAFVADPTAKAMLNGAEWSEFSLSRVVVIGPAARTPVKELSDVVDLATGRPAKILMDLPVGP